MPRFGCRHALLFRDRFNFTGLDAAVTPALLEQICSTPGALSQVFGATHLVPPLKLTGSGSGWFERHPADADGVVMPLGGAPSGDITLALPHMQRAACSPTWLYTARQGAPAAGDALRRLDEETSTARPDCNMQWNIQVSCHINEHQSLLHSYHDADCNYHCTRLQLLRHVNRSASACIGLSLYDVNTLH